MNKQNKNKYKTKQNKTMTTKKHFIEQTRFCIFYFNSFFFVGISTKKEDVIMQIQNKKNYNTL